jgi:hypothetical protein
MASSSALSQNGYAIIIAYANAGRKYGYSGEHQVPNSGYWAYSQSVSAQQ